MNDGQKEATGLYLLGTFVVFLGLFVAVQTRSVAIMVITMFIGVGFIIMGDKRKDIY